MKALIFSAAFLSVAALTGPLLSAPPDQRQSSDAFEQVPRANLDVSDGQVGENQDGSLAIASPEVRATQQSPSAKAARLVFIFHGPTEQRAKLASGEEARQIGLKLRAKNTCNLLYVMWKLDGTAEVVVSVKRNPGMTTHSECGAQGYMKVQSAFQEKPEKLPSAADGKPHTLEARLSKPDAKAYELIVTADGNRVWQGPIDAKLLDDIDGPAGFRSDNGIFTFKFYSLPPSAVTYGSWKQDQKNDRYSCVYRYPSKSNPSRLNSQTVLWYPNDADRKGYYFFASTSGKVWGRCVRPDSPDYNPRLMQWARIDKNNWTDLPAGASPAPSDGDPARAAIDKIPDPPG